MTRRDKERLKEVEALLKDNKRQREEIVNLYGHVIEAQERLKKLVRMIKTQEEEPTNVKPGERWAIYPRDWPETQLIALSGWIMALIILMLVR